MTIFGDIICCWIFSCYVLKNYYACFKLIEDVASKSLYDLRDSSL